MDETKKVRSLKGEIERRTQNTTKLIALEAQKVAIGEMVMERLDDILALLREAGFKVSVHRPLVAGRPAPVPANVTVVQDTGAEPVAPLITNPCALCGKEAHGTDTMPDNSKQFLCRDHFMQRAKEKQEEQVTKSLLGSEGTLFKRPVTQPTHKVIINSPPTPDPLKGPFGGPAPVNHVLDDD